MQNSKHLCHIGTIRSELQYHNNWTKAESFGLWGKEKPIQMLVILIFNIDTETDFKIYAFL